jgi:hypothetical protein
MRNIFNFQKTKKTHKRLKPTYLTNYLNKMKQIEEAI